MISRKDLQWMLGILLVPIVGATLLASILEYLLRREVAVPLVSTAIASSFSPKGLDEAGDIEKLRKQILASSEKEFRPIPTMNLVLTREEIQTLSPRAVRVRIFEQIAAPLYDQGIKGVVALAPKGTDTTEFENSVKLISFASAENHAFVGRIASYLMLACGALLLLLILLSRRAGRLFAPGLVLLLGTLPVFILTSIPLSIAKEKVSAQTETVERISQSNIVSRFVHESLGPELIHASGSVKTTLTASALLLTVSMFWGAVSRIRGRRKRPTENEKISSPQK